MSNWGRLEHLIWGHLAEHGLQQRESFALCISGGLDSMVLLNIFFRLKSMARIKVLHYHHGFDENHEVSAFRDKSSDLVQKTVKNFGRPNITFVTQKSSLQLKSEEQFRDARWNFFEDHSTTEDVIVTAHHLDDHFDTVLLKMIRGSSMDGVSSFQMWNGRIFRPLLRMSKSELREYAQISHLNWVDDPSNQQTDYLRNWIRSEWLESLEKRLPGGKANLAKSLFKMIEDHNEDRTFEESYLSNSVGNTLNRQWFSLLSHHNQNRSLALFLKRHSVYEFTAGQLEEIRKRLDKNQKELTFEMLGRKWVINATQIVLE